MKILMFSTHSMKYIWYSPQKSKYPLFTHADLIERQSINVTLPLMEEIGGWPVLGSNPGGHWNDAEFDIVSLLVTLRKYNNKPVIDLGVSSDTKNTTQHIIFVSMLL